MHRREPLSPQWENYLDAHRAAAARIRANRGRMSDQHARDILRMEAERRGIRLSAEELARADTLNRPRSPLLHWLRPGLRGRDH